jgi:hypothetical protein
MLMLMPVMVAAQDEEVNSAPPSIGQTMVREGDFAFRLATALSVGTPVDEIEAENQLASAGIMPKNGWIADYPVTPDIVDELYKAVRDAAASSRIALSVDVALQRLNEVMEQSGLSIETPSSGKAVTSETKGVHSSPSATVINNYYQTEGPPTITYYAPPPDYYYMYGWVPSPFWSAGIWFPGFFILHDFHRPVIIDNRVVFVSNHFRDLRHRRFVRIDPVTRFHGSAIAETRVIHSRDGVPAIGTRRERAITSEQRIQRAPNIPAVRHPSRNGAVVNTTVSSGAAGKPATFSTQSRGNRTISVQSRNEAVNGMNSRVDRTGNSWVRGSGASGSSRMERAVLPAASSNRAFTMPNRGDRDSGFTSRGGGGFDRMPVRSGGASGGRGRR